ncbi:glycosyltransferase involved in cell wall biosynthesis [Desulfohalotomaculum tongense]|uniref:glycosyltransferase family 2 protein n=1 Tax=Desulforadius tongensis TaxID=1216062 RepID=UPI0019573508|nr:glycosyltransferase family 2 protein [Desulforadius tongensis]MBM7854713.1 glycosyltransferase involved in cell wall biosynthesis [Desulforadius tongensis]
MSNYPPVSVVIPAYNESKYIYHTVSAAKNIPEVTEVIVVDDASQDDTALKAEQAGARVIKLASNLGKGGALTRGVQEAVGEVLLLMDGDLGDTARQGRELLLPVLEGNVDMTVAKFPRSNKKAGFGLVKGLARAGIRYFAGIEVEAPLSGQRAMTRKVAEDIMPFASGYGVEVGLTIKVARLGYKIMEVPVQMTHAETGRDWAGFKHRGRQFIHVAKELAFCMLRYGKLPSR